MRASDLEVDDYREEYGEYYDRALNLGKNAIKGSTPERAELMREWDRVRFRILRAYGLDTDG